MSDANYILAMYDVRAKQNFIFRTNKLQEIIGASWIIRDVFKDYLFPAAEELCNEDGEKNKGIFSYKEERKNAPSKTKEELAFTKGGFETHLKHGYIGEVVYDGGGNFLLVYKDEKTFQEVTYEFTKRVMESVGTLRVLATCVTASEGFSDYKGDQKRLYEKHRIAEANESVIAPWSCLPIVQVDRKTSQTLFDYTTDVDWEKLDKEIQKTIQSKGVNGKLTKESYAKLKKYLKEQARIDDTPKNELDPVEGEYKGKGQKILDKLALEKGVDSQIAIIYIDGNSMGAKVEKAIEGMNTYNDCSEKLRELSDDIQKTYVDNGIKAALSVREGKDDFRIVVYAGDEINIIVNAHDAFFCAKQYLDYLKNVKDKNGEDKKASSCAGIAVFHSHAPYAEAYRIAEEACETGKKLMKKAEMECASFIDFHICQGAFGTSLEDIRKRENGDIISRPWMMWNKDVGKKKAECQDYEVVEKIINILNYFSRTNVKGLANAAMKSDTALLLELRRMYAHLPEKDKNGVNQKIEVNNAGWTFLMDMEPMRRRKIIYDIAIAYDLWFDNGSDKNEQAKDKSDENAEGAEA